MIEEACCVTLHLLLLVTVTYSQFPYLSLLQMVSNCLFYVYCYFNGASTILFFYTFELFLSVACLYYTHDGLLAMAYVVKQWAMGGTGELARAALNT